MNNSTERKNQRKLAEVRKDMSPKYRETSWGGLALKLPVPEACPKAAEPVRIRWAP